MKHKKFVFGADSLDYLGHRVTIYPNEVQPHHIQGIIEFPTSKRLKEVHSFFGTANWLREYIPQFAEVTAPITDLLQQKRFHWTHTAEIALQRLK